MKKSDLPATGIEPTTSNLPDPSTLPTELSGLSENMKQYLLIYIYCGREKVASAASTLYMLDVYMSTIYHSNSTPLPLTQVYLYPHV